MDDTPLTEQAPRLLFHTAQRKPGPHRSESDAVYPLRLFLRNGGLAVELRQSDMVLGRHSDADVRLPLPDVSRRHCRFVFSAGRWRVIDLGSLNGIYVNGELVQQAELRHSDTLRIGGFVFEVDLRQGERTVQLAG